MIRDASELLYPAVVETLAELGLLGEDAGMAKLARQYARTIDEQTTPKLYAWALWRFGPELQKTLESLGASPVARARMKKGGDDAAEDPLSQLPVRRRGA